MACLHAAKLLHKTSSRVNYTDQTTSAKLVPTFADRGVLHGQRFGSSTAIISIFYEWTPFQIHHFSENLVAPGIEPGPLDL
jgi:hypothetical protein